MVQAQRKHEKIDDHDTSDVSEDHLPPALAELAMRTLAASATFSEKRADLRAAEGEFRVAKRTIAAAEQAASAPDWSELGPEGCRDQRGNGTQRRRCRRDCNAHQAS